MNILAFAASSSTTSINKQLVTYAASLLPDATTEVIDINDYPLPIFSENLEKELGQPESALKFFNKLKACDAIIISFAEHNGSYTAAYKNLFDWTSRIERGLFHQKSMVLLATSPGPSGGKNVLSAAVASAPHFAGNVKASLSIPHFYDNFDVTAQQLSNAELKLQLQNTVNSLITP